MSPKEFLMMLNTPETSIYLLPPAKKVYRKVMFSQACVSHSVYGDLPSHNANGQADPPPPLRKQTAPDTVNRRAVRIILECILVLHVMGGSDIITETAVMLLFRSKTLYSCQ